MGGGREGREKGEGQGKKGEGVGKKGEGARGRRVSATLRHQIKHTRTIITDIVYIRVLHKPTTWRKSRIPRTKENSRRFYQCLIMPISLVQSDQ